MTSPGQSESSGASEPGWPKIDDGSVPAIDKPISAASRHTKTEAELEEREKRIEICLLSLAARAKLPNEAGNQNAKNEYELAVASLAELIHHTAFCDDASTLVPLAEIAIRALRIETPNIALAMDLIIEIEGRLFMRSEIAKFPFLFWWKLKTSTPRVSAVDVVTKALPFSFGIFIIGLLLSEVLLNFFLGRCATEGAAGCQSANEAFVSAAYVTATVWGFFGGVASVMLRSVTTDRLRLNQLRGLYYTTIYKPWLGSIFAVIVYFGVNTEIVTIAQPAAGMGKVCLWGILGFVAGFGERLVPDLVTKLEGSIGSSTSAK